MRVRNKCPFNIFMFAIIKVIENDSKEGIDMLKFHKETHENDEQKQNKRAIILMGLLLLVGISVLLGSSYALFSIVVKGNKKVSIETEEFKMDMKDGEYIKIDALGTMSDEEGKMSKPYTFTITKNPGKIGAYYSLYLTEESGELNTYYLKYELKGTDGSIKEGRIGTLDKFYWSKYLEAGSSVTYELRLWLKGSQLSTGGPVLSDNMIPVVYNEEKGKWVTTTDKDNQWYNYDKQEWANAITVRENVRSSYQVAGKEVDIENDVLQMFVWIPRYSYTIKSEDGVNYYGKKEEGRSDNPSISLPGEIDVKFISTSTKDTGSAQYTGYVPNGWYTPPGFTFGDKELPGIWIGKFETGSVTGASPGDVETDNLVAIKPNITSWRNIRVSTLELVSMGITKAGNIYGFDQSTYDSHAAKDTEWALISYFTQSQYGKYGNSLYTGENKEVYMNNYNMWITGKSSGQGTASSSAEEGFAYNDLIDRGNGQGYAGAGASSTGNITGIYDINGGAWEYTMGVLNKLSGNTETINSGYSGLLADGNSFTSDREWPSEKYYDLYTTTDTKTACNGAPCKGHALGEVAGWYGDWLDMVSTTQPWVMRGGYHESATLTGSFAFGRVVGQESSWISFRIVLTPQS